MQFMLFSLLTILATKQKASVGIDLGTTFTCVYVSYMQDDNATIELVKFDGLETIPSVVKRELVQDKYMLLAGRKAQNAYEKDFSPLRYYYQAKRLLGRAALNEHVELMNFNEKVTYSVVETKQGNLSKLTMCYLDQNGNTIDEITPLEVSAEILKFVRQEIEKNYELEEVVITVPVNYLENQKSATLHAARLAGFPNPTLLFEPVAAAYACESKKPSEKRVTKYIVYDHGGGTLDVAVFDFGEGVLETPHSSGLMFNGGEDFTKLLTEHLREELKKRGCVIADKSRDHSKLRTLAEEFKIRLCDLQNDLDASGVTENAKVSANFSTSVSTYFLELDTATFNTVIEPKLKEIREMFEGGDNPFIGIIKNKLKWNLNEIDRVLCVGGSSRVPIIRKMLGNYFGKNKIITDIDADKIVAEGAAYYAAKGAGYLKGADRITLITTVPIPIGICVNENTFFELIKLGASLPAQGKEKFTTSYDNQPAVMIRVAQGLRPSFKDNNFLGEFELKIQNKAPKGVPQIEITAEWDMTGDLRVTAIDTATQLEEKIIFNRADASITPEMIEKLTKEAKENESRDAELMATYKERQQLEAYIDSVKQRMIGPEIDQQSRIKIEKEVNVITNWLEREKNSADKNDFINKKNELEKVVEPLFEAKVKGQPREEL